MQKVKKKRQEILKCHIYLMKAKTKGWQSFLNMGIVHISSRGYVSSFLFLQSSDIFTFKLVGKGCFPVKFSFK